jgi:hypothetical protein
MNRTFGSLPYQTAPLPWLHRFRAIISQTDAGTGIRVLHRLRGSYNFDT